MHVIMFKRVHYKIHLDNNNYISWFGLSENSLYFCTVKQYKQ
jgi:hypothetical protein